MSGIWGKNIRLSIFGESHGEGIGIVIDGLSAGIKIDLEFIEFEMQRRSPGNDELSTPRKETDKFEILSGYFNSRTTGAPLCAFIKNTNTMSGDYDLLRYTIRPGHADYTGNIKYKGFNDYRGGGHFSGRLTAALVFAGAVAKQILLSRSIMIGSHICQIGSIADVYFDKTNIQGDTIEKLRNNRFPVLDAEKGIKMQELILNVKKEKNSIGGVVETAIINLPVGVGEPFFDSVESTISHMIFSIPAVKGIEFGEGFNISKMTGIEANDEFTYENGKAKTTTNNNGGILGGITNGMPVIFKTAFKPTPSIGKAQSTINIKDIEDTELEIKGRHDPCIVQRAVPVVEAGAAVAIIDLLHENEKGW